MSSRRLFAETLPVSIGAHAVIIGALLVANVWTLEFPGHSPKMHQLYQVFEAPLPPPPPPPPAAARQTVTRQTAVAVEEIVAPTVIPDEIPIVTQELPTVVQMPPDGVTEGVQGGVEGGVIGGSLAGVDQGEIGGTLGGAVGGVLTDAPANTVVVQRDAMLPMTAMSRVYPRYPEEARLRGHEDMVLVRYTIARNGRVREVKVLQSGERKEFTDATVNAIRHWRFRPMIKDGQAQEVVHELTIYFRLSAAGVTG